ncbi:MAG TPA: hypothetical protein VFE98_09910 [Candidatus Bathyarchaeia archaeon]|nr:hypothetical protein [Candidatus Bathyarchaeia archaeon]
MTCEIVTRKGLLESCKICRKLEKEHTIWNFVNPDTTEATTKFLNHVRRSHPEGLEHHERLQDKTTHIEYMNREFLATIRDCNSQCERCKTLEQLERTLRETDERESWEHNVTRLLHEYEVHAVPHREILGTDNYFMSVSEISRVTNPQFTKAIKAEVKRRAGYKCECCHRSWKDVANLDEETVYFETLKCLKNDVDLGKSESEYGSFPELAKSTYWNYFYSDIGEKGFRNYTSVCKSCGASLQIFTGWFMSQRQKIQPSKWFQVHHKNFRHFDNRLENLEYLCGNCHGAKGRSSDSEQRKDDNWYHGRTYVQSLLEYMKSRGIKLSYVFLDENDSFDWCVIGERQD